MKNSGEPLPQHEILLYIAPGGKMRVEVAFEDETFWMTPEADGRALRVDVRMVSYHVTEIFESEELNELATIRKDWIVQSEGSRTVRRELEFYSLDTIMRLATG